MEHEMIYLVDPRALRMGLDFLRHLDHTKTLFDSHRI